MMHVRGTLSLATGADAHFADPTPKYTDGGAPRSTAAVAMQSDNHQSANLAYYHPPFNGSPTSNVARVFW
jgi:hypothetical protein